MSDARLAIIISAVNQASRELKQIRDEVQGVDTAGKNAKKGGFAQFKDGIDQAAGAALKAYAAFKVVKGAIDKVYGAAKEGAELAYLEQRFDNLSRSIGTTKDALLGDLRTAVKGTKSDAELMSGALDMMALGLAKNHDETVRLTAVAGALGWNMDQLTLTITNESTKRLDSLGLSIGSVQGRYEQLKNQGVDGQRAMMLAVVEAGEAMIDTQGHVGDSTLGAYAKMEASQTNFFNLLKGQLAEGATGWAEFWNRVYQSGVDSLNRNALIDRISELIPEMQAKVESGVEKTLDTADKSFGEIYSLYASGSANLGFMISDNLELKQSWDELLDKPGAVETMSGILDKFEQLPEATRRLYSASIDWDKYLQSQHYRETIDAQIADSVRWQEAINKTGSHYDAYADAQQAVIDNYERIRAEREAAFEEAKAGYIEMNTVLQEVTGSTDNANYAMVGWLNSQRGVSTFVSLAKTYTVEMNSIADNQARIAELQEIIQNQGGVFEGTKISAKQASEKIDELNGEIAKSEERMKSLAKEAVINFMITSTMEDDTLSNAEKLQKTIDLLTASGELSQEAVTALTADLSSLFAAYGGENEIGLRVIAELDSSQVDNWTPSRKILQVAAQFDTSSFDSWQPQDRYVNIYTNLINRGIERATGGTVTTAASGSPVSTGRGDYLWQEYGYPGEIFVPSMSGYILSKADASRAVAAGQSSAMDYGSFESAFENALTRVLEKRDLRAGVQAQPLRSAFENVRNW